MAEIVTTGTWLVDETNREAFLEAWAAFAKWSSDQPGAGTLRLGRDRSDAGRYVSFADWESLEVVQSWKSNPEQRERLSAVRQYVADFHSEELEVVVSATQSNIVTNAAVSSER